MDWRQHRLVSWRRGTRYTIQHTVRITNALSENGVLWQLLLILGWAWIFIALCLSSIFNNGYTKMLVTSVGMNTIWGEMMSSISLDTNEQTPLQVRLNKLTSSIDKVGLAVAFLVLVVLLVWYFTGNTTDENGNKEFNGNSTKVDDILNAVVGYVAAAVTIVVVAILEGLPLAVTLTLAYSMKRMMAD